MDGAPHPADGPRAELEARDADELEDARAARGLGQGEQSVTSPGTLAFQAEVDAELWEWRRDRAAMHTRIASRASTLSLFRYHAGRARTLGEAFAERAKGCGEPGGPWLELHCGRCGEVHRLAARCQLRAWCGDCAVRRASRLKRRVVPALGAALREARQAWGRDGAPKGRRPELTMLTLTVRHSGDLELDRQRLERGWQRLRAWWWRDVGSPVFLRAWESTKGRDELGHVHAHVVAILPKMNLRALDAEWERATDGHGINVDVKQRQRAEAQGKRHRQTRRGSAQAAAAYLCAYVTKGVHPADHTPATAAAWVRSIHGRRLVTTSRKLLEVLPPAPSPCCHEDGGTMQGPAKYHREGHALEELHGPPPLERDPPPA